MTKKNYNYPVIIFTNGLIASTIFTLEKYIMILIYGYHGKIKILGKTRFHNGGIIKHLG
jgi:hypothetical protein